MNAEGDIEGASPSEIGRDFVSISRDQYDALLTLVVMAAQLRASKQLPPDLELALRRVEQRFAAE